MVAIMAVVALLTLGVALLSCAGAGAAASASAPACRLRQPGARSRRTSAARRDAPASGMAPSRTADRRAGARELHSPKWSSVADRALAGLAARRGVARRSTRDAKMLVPMDEAQTDHLKAYGLAYWALTRARRASGCSTTAAARS